MDLLTQTPSSWIGSIVLLLGLWAVFSHGLHLVPPPPDDDEEEEDEEDDDEGDDDGDKDKGGEGDDDGEPISAKAHRKALARERAKSARRFRKLEKRHSAELSKLREDLGLDGEGDDEGEGEDDAKGKKPAKKKGNPWAARAKKEQERRQELERKLAQRDAESGLRSAAKKLKGDADLLIGILGPKVRTDGEDPYVQMTVDGELVDLDLEAAVEETLRRHPRLLLSKKTPSGGGTRKPRGGQAGGKAGKRGAKKAETLEEAGDVLRERLKDL